MKYTLTHITSEDNGEADILSRSMLVISNKNERIEEIRNLINSINEISSESNKSPETYTLLEKLHISLIHPGRNKMQNTLKKYLDTKNLKTLISKIKKNCHQCQKKRILLNTLFQLNSSPNPILEMK
ncbi:hypothetical protein DMUE_4859 [Dictyocoela muelleri]|nr:hypothetical protein DMUE_4859 [Dictyocoela muelleri]